MGRKNNQKIENQLKKAIVLIVILLVLAVASKTGILEKIDTFLNETGIIETTGRVKENSNIITKVSENIILDENKLNILFLDVGQADSELIIYKGKTILIDAGNVNDGENIVNGIKALGISKLDYIIGTHVHEDHIGGMSYIIDEFEIGEFYLPYNTKATSNYYKNLLTSLTKKQLMISEAKVGDKIQIEDLICEIMSVDNSEPEDANDSSIVTQITYGELKYLFMGDATSRNENTRSWEDIDVLKVGHHGSNTSSTEKFLNKVLPEIAVIPVGEGNSYELPKEQIINRLNNLGSITYRTDKDGTIQIISDGKTNEIVKIDISFDGNYE